MSRPVCVCLVALLLAGCASPSVPPPDVATPSAAAPVVAWSNPGFFATEPTLAVSRGGTVFFAAADGTGESQTHPVFRSRDGGRTWTEVSPRLPDGQRTPPVGVDPFVHVDEETGRLFHMVMHTSRTCAHVHWSDNEGDAWTINPAGCGTLPPYDHQSLATGKPRILRTVGYPNVVYQCLNRVLETACSRSLDGGLAWVATVAPFEGFDLEARDPLIDPYLCGGLAGHLEVAPDGSVLLPRNWCGRPFLAISRDDGLTWRKALVGQMPSTYHHDPVVAADATNAYYYAWLNLTGALWLSRSADAGQTWSTPVLVTPPGMTANLPSIDARDPGEIAIQFLGTTDIPGGFQHPEFQQQARPVDGVINRAVWYPYLVVSTEADGPSPSFEQHQASPPGDPINRGNCDTRYCAGFYGDYQEVEIAPDGTVYAAFADHCVDRCLLPNATHRNNVGWSGRAPAGFAAWTR